MDRLTVTKDSYSMLVGPRTRRRAIIELRDGDIINKFLDNPMFTRDCPSR